MEKFSEERLTEAAIARLADCPDPRFKQIMSGVIRHLHALAREIKLTEAEWFAAIQFLTATGQKCDDKRQEFILLSDTLGLSMMVDAINHARQGAETHSTVLGPFYVAGAPDLPMGADIARAGGGEPTEVSGRVLDGQGRPLAGATLDVWQTAANGFYDVQDPSQPQHNLRGRFRTGADGAYRFRTVKPVSYPVPVDGPVGKMLLAMGRHPYRPAHLHFIITAPDYETLTTHIFVRGDAYLESDAVFGVKPSLIVDFTPGPEPGSFTASYDFTLKRLA